MITGPHAVKTPYLNRKRNQLLYAVFTKNYRMAQAICAKTWETIEHTDGLLESEQKTLNQIRHVLRIYRKHCTPDMHKLNQRMRRKMAHITRVQRRNVQFIDYDSWTESLGLSRKALGIMLGHVGSLQITTGCGGFCRRCNEWALPGVRKQFTWGAVKKLITRICTESDQGTALYSASDPLDWRHGKRTMADINQFITEHGYAPSLGLLTKIPAGTEEIARRLLETEADIAVSITSRNRRKIRQIEKSVNKCFQVQHDVNELTIAAGLDEDFQSIKSSITDNYGVEITPEGACQTIPTFTSALHPTGQCRILITRNTGCFFVKKTGRASLPVEYFKPLSAVDTGGKAFILERLLEPQIENILLDNGFEDLVPPGMMNMKSFFDTLEPKAAAHRKQLFLSVLQDRQKAIFSPKGSPKETPKARIKCFQRHIRRHLNFANMEMVEIYKRNAFSYYLKAISDYLRRYPVERVIIRRLRESDRQGFENIGRTIGYHREQSVDDLLATPKTGAFEKFQLLSLALLNHPDNQAIQQFIAENPARYDPEIDGFVCA